MAVPPAPVRVPGQRPLAPSVTSVTSVANDKTDNEVTSEAEYRFPGTRLTAEDPPPKYNLICNESYEIYITVPFLYCCLVHCAFLPRQRSFHFILDMKFFNYSIFPWYANETSRISNEGFFI